MSLDVLGSFICLWIVYWLLGARERVPSAKCLLQKHRDLGSNPQSPCYAGHGNLRTLTVRWQVETQESPDIWMMGNLCQLTIFKVWDQVKMCPLGTQRKTQGRPRFSPPLSLVPVLHSWAWTTHSYFIELAPFIIKKDKINLFGVSLVLFDLR